MSTFRVGQKVVFIGSEFNDPTINYPNVNEIVTVVGKCSVHNDCIDIVEHPRDKNGCMQSFMTYLFRPLIDESFGERICAEITQQVKQENLVSL